MFSLGTDRSFELSSLRALQLGLTGILSALLA